MFVMNSSGISLKSCSPVLFRPILKSSNRVLNVQSMHHQLPKVILYTANKNQFIIYSFCISLAKSTLQNEMIKKIYIRFYDPKSLSNPPLEYSIDWTGKTFGSHFTHFVIDEQEFPVDYQKVMESKSFDAQSMEESTRFISIRFLSANFEYEHTTRIVPLAYTLAAALNVSSSCTEKEIQRLKSFVSSPFMNCSIDLETRKKINYFNLISPVTLTAQALCSSIKICSFNESNP